MLSVSVCDRECFYKNIKEIAYIRLAEFSEYPDLYVSTIDRQRLYFDNFFNDPDGLLLLFKDEDNIVGFLSSLPLKVYEKYIKDLTEKLLERDISIRDCYCVTDVIVLKPYRKKGLARKGFDFQEKFAIEKGFKKTILFNTVGDPFSPLRPKNHITNDTFFEKLSFKLMNITMTMNYLTRQPDGSSKKQNHYLKFWEKNL
jgi:GNAT superfamily N-acetyltransferase